MLSRAILTKRTRTSGFLRRHTPVIIAWDIPQHSLIRKTSLRTTTCILQRYSFNKTFHSTFILILICAIRSGRKEREGGVIAIGLLDDNTDRSSLGS